jgi:hypothetical protein
MTGEQMFEVPGSRLTELTNNIARLSQQKDDAYAERDKVIAALTKSFPSHLTRHKDMPGESWDAEWLNVVCIHLPTGQATWHIHISELPWFAHLNGINLICHGYDGYTTAEKYQRLFDLPTLWRNGLLMRKDPG